MLPDCVGEKDLRILLATPLYSAHHWDSGHFWLKAFNSLGNYVRIWDYRLELDTPVGQWDFTLIMKGESVDPETLPHPRFCYWPDALDRTPSIETLLAKYDKVFTPVRPTPADMEWLPSGFDPDIHHYNGAKKDIPSLYIGTNNGQRKIDFLKKIRPSIIAGNNWGGVAEQINDGYTQPIRLLLPQYLHDFVALASRAQVLINIHQGPQVPVGVNRKLFECCACGLTISDRVPGVVEILGPDLAQLVTFDTPQEGRELLEYWSDRTQEERDEIWGKEKKAIEPFTYVEGVKRILNALPL